ncbi:TlpA family protein disulfide reductase [Persephonella sp.]
MKNIILSTAAAILLLSFISYGKKAPDVYFEDLSGKKVYVEDFRGKPTVLVFWQLYCHSCKDELPKISKLAKKYKGKVRFYAVVIGTRDILQIEEKKREWGFDMPVLIAGYKAESSFGIFGTPITVVIDRDLEIAGKIIGSKRTHILEKILNKIIQE